jgi:hypothetical protein
MKQRCNCTQEPKLRQTGWSGNHPEWYCPVCKKKYYTEKDGLLTSERPFKWPSKKVTGQKITVVKKIPFLSYWLRL